jgi:hypothetical protein
MNKACSTHGREEECIRGMVRNPEGKIPLGILGRRLEDNIKIALREIELYYGFCSSGSV